MRLRLVLFLHSVAVFGTCTVGVNLGSENNALIMICFDGVSTGYCILSVYSNLSALGRNYSQEMVNKINHG